MNFFKIISTTIFLCAFIYFEYFGLSSKLINTIFALSGFYLLFSVDKKELFYIGFLTSIVWFWWIAYSFIYYDLSYLIPLVIIGIGLIYAILFYFIGLFDNLYYKLFYIFALSFICPFGFNWFELKLLFVNSYIGITNLDFALVLISIVILKSFTYTKRYLVIIPLIFTLSYKNHTINSPDLKIKLANINIAQDIKWQKHKLQQIIQINLDAINQAISEKYDLVVLPETTLPMVLNQNRELVNILKQKAKSIDIIIGSLYFKSNQYQNASYFFTKDKLQIATKVVLIPFGEAVPLPEKIRDFINNTFYDGAKDYIPALKPTDFTIKGIKFRNAICYEATTDKIFENLDTKYMIAISNNAWFVPSIQPTLQKLLLKYYSKKYNIMIFSVNNMSANYIIK
jgi:apolipoprotein N-acyltransferase